MSSFIEARVAVAVARPVVAAAEVAAALVARTSVAREVFAETLLGGAAARPHQPSTIPAKTRRTFPASR